MRAHFLFVALTSLINAAAAVEISTSKQVLSAIESASDGETIQLQAGTYVGVCGAHLRKNLTIEGSGIAILDCGGEGVQLSIAGFGVSVSLLNLAFARGYSATDGGCLTVSHGAHASLSGCSFSDCVAAARGGALFAEDSATVHMSQTTFTGCPAHQGGAVCVRDHDTKAVMQDCTILNNSAALDGGGVFVESAHLNIDGPTRFVRNTAPGGGGIAAKQVENSTRAFAVTISSGAHFQENFAHPGRSGVVATGGAIDLNGVGSFVSAGAVTYDGNSALEAEASGGTFCVLGAITFVLSGNAVVSRSFASKGGALFANFGAYVEVRDGPVFSHNEALTYGGSLYVLGVGTVLHVEHRVRIEHSSALMAGGGVSSSEGPNFNFFHDVNLTHNYAGRYGGGLNIYFRNKVEMRGRVLFQENYAGIDGGGLSIWTVATVNLTAGTSFRRNSAARGGAGVKVGPGGVLYADGVGFTDNIVTSVEPSVGGGAILNQHGTMHLSHCYFARNLALVSAAISWGGGGNCTGSRFEHHVAQVGAGVTLLSDMAVTLANNTFYNNSASIDGGCLVSAETSVLHLGPAVFDACTAGNNGAAMLLTDAGVVHVTGHVIMQHGAAGSLGGAIHHQGKLLEIQEAAELTLTSNEARAGGGMSSTKAVTVLGHLSVVNNTAREGDGGGVHGLGVLAVTAVSDSGWLELTRNQATRGNGGGMALLDNARLAFDLESGCPAACISLGDGMCDGACLLPQCRWDAGDCDTAMVDAGEEATLPCVRDSLTDYKCPLWSLEDAGQICFAGCLSASCEWGFGSESCAAPAAAIGHCPYTSALIYDSITANPAVRYVKDGGTAGGFGRCENGQCNRPDASLGREEPYCTTMHDGGQVLEMECTGCTATVEVGESWGPCAPPEKPRLPHVGFDYDPDELRAVIGMDIPSVLRHYSACGFQPISITANRAGLAGGGVYKDRCEAFLEDGDRCFVGELSNQRLPTAVIDLADNHAGGPGGGFFVECAQMSACLRLMQQTPGLPTRGNASLRLLHFGAESSAEAYGALAGGPPVQLELTSWSRAATPGQSLVDVAFSLRDVQGQTVRGSAAWPNPHVVEVWVTEAGSEARVQPPWLLRAHPTDELTSTVATGELLAFCPMDHHKVAVHVRAMLDSSSGTALEQSVVVDCEPCGPGQGMVFAGRNHSLWACEQCASSEYVVSAAGGCQPCPVEGAACDGAILTPAVASAEWEVDHGALRLASCPAGYIVVRDPARPVLDQCVACPGGKFSFNRARYGSSLSVLRPADAPGKCGPSNTAILAFCGGLLLFSALAAALYVRGRWRVQRDADEVAIAQRVEELRTLLWLRPKDGFRLEGEWTRGTAVIQRRRLDNLARMSLLMDFEAAPVDALTMSLKSSADVSASASVVLDGEAPEPSPHEPKQYRALLNLLLHICKELLDPRTDTLASSSLPVSTTQQRIREMSAEERFAFFSRKICKLWVWDDPTTLACLKGLAQIYMDMLRGACDDLYTCIAAEEGADELLSLSFEPGDVPTRQDDPCVKAIPVVDSMHTEMMARQMLRCASSRTASSPSQSGRPWLARRASSNQSLAASFWAGEGEPLTPSTRAKRKSGNTSRANASAQLLEDWINIRDDHLRLRSFWRVGSGSSHLRWEAPSGFQLGGGDSKMSHRDEEQRLRLWWELECSLHQKSKHRVTADSGAILSQLEHEEPFVQFLEHRAETLNGGFQDKGLLHPQPSHTQIQSLAWPIGAAPHAVLPGPVKRRERMLEKVGEYMAAEDAGSMTPLVAMILDPVRASVVCDGAKHVVAVARFLVDSGAKHGLPVVKVKNKFGVADSSEFDGYRDVMLSVVFEGALGLRIIGEVQVQDKRMNALKVKMHRLYKVKRSARACNVAA